jgi:hypothetical protein
VSRGPFAPQRRHIAIGRQSYDSCQHSANAGGVCCRVLRRRRDAASPPNLGRRPGSTRRSDMLYTDPRATACAAVRTRACHAGSLLLIGRSHRTRNSVSVIPFRSVLSSGVLNCLANSAKGLPLSLCVPPRATELGSKMVARLFTERSSHNPKSKCPFGGRAGSNSHFDFSCCRRG